MQEGEESNIVQKLCSIYFMHAQALPAKEHHGKVGHVVCHIFPSGERCRPQSLDALLALYSGQLASLPSTKEALDCHCCFKATVTAIKVSEQMECSIHTVYTVYTARVCDKPFTITRTTYGIFFLRVC